MISHEIWKLCVQSWKIVCNYTELVVNLMKQFDTERFVCDKSKYVVFVNSYNFHEKQWFHMEFESVVYNLWRLFVITQNWIWMLWKPLQLNDISWNWNQSRKHTSAHRNVLGQDVRQVLLLETLFVCSHFGFVKLLWLTVAGLGGADVLARWPADIVSGVRPGPSGGEHCRGACLHLQPPLDRCGLKP